MCTLTNQTKELKDWNSMLKANQLDEKIARGAVELSLELLSDSTQGSFVSYQYNRIHGTFTLVYLTCSITFALDTALINPQTETRNIQMFVSYAIEQFAVNLDGTPSQINRWGYVDWINKIETLKLLLRNCADYPNDKMKKLLELLDQY